MLEYIVHNYTILKSCPDKTSTPMRINNNGSTVVCDSLTIHKMLRDRGLPGCCEFFLRWC